MKKNGLTYLFVVLLLSVFSFSAEASTDVLNNILNQTNIFLTQAGNIQKKYSDAISNYMSLKVNPDLGGIQQKLEKLQKKKEKAESLKEKAERIKKFIKTATTKAQELKAKYDKISAEATKLYAEAQEGISAGQELTEDFKTRYMNLDDSNSSNNHSDNSNDNQDNPTSIPSDMNDAAAALWAESPSENTSLPSLATTAKQISSPASSVNIIDNIRGDASYNTADTLQAVAKMNTESNLTDMTVLPPKNIKNLKQIKEISLDDIVNLKAVSSDSKEEADAK